MRNVRHHPDPFTQGPGGRARFNVLLTEDRWHGPDHWSRLLPRLMEPMGVASYTVRCGQEAIELVRQVPIRAALVDLATPRMPQPATSTNTDSDAGSQESVDSESTRENPAAVPGGLWLLELFKRMPIHPPVVIVRSRTITTRDVNRLLQDALKLGAFTVMENPRLEQILTVFQRLLDRLYQGQWPE